MVLMLDPCQAIREISLVMVVYVGKACNAGALDVLGFARFREMHMKNVADSFGAVAIAFGCNVLVELLGQSVIEGDSETFHISSVGLHA